MSLNQGKSELVFQEVHEIDERTADVITQTTFENLMINQTIVESLSRHSYHRPSPVQAKAIPLGLMGMDMLVQAKTGTGKTLVFAVLCADQLINASARERVPQVMIVSPTREIAMQTYEVVRKICPKNFFHGLFVGGVDMELDKNVLRKGCQVAVGTSGRLAHLVKSRILNPKKIALFVLDEADKLMEDSFRAEVNFLFSSLTPEFAQVCVFSATYPRRLDHMLCNYMKEPSLVRLNADDCQLLGIKQYVVIDETHSEVETLERILCSITFTQCLVFSNDQKRCAEISEHLTSHDILASHFSASLSQEERFKVMKSFKNFRIRILVSSDLSARGIDAEHVNLIINMECPNVSESYLHRIGRAGRFGTKGAALTILANDKEVYRFKMLVRRENLNIKFLDLKEKYPNDLPVNLAFFEKSKSFTQLMEEDDAKNANLRAQSHSTFAENGDDSESEHLNDNEDLQNGNEVQKLPSSKPKIIVPLRPAHRRKYYLRREMIAIRDLASPAEWREYGRKFLGFDDSEICCFLAKNLSNGYDQNGLHNGKAHVPQNGVKAVYPGFVDGKRSTSKSNNAWKSFFSNDSSATFSSPQNETRILGGNLSAGADEWEDCSKQSEIPIHKPSARKSKTVPIGLWNDAADTSQRKLNIPFGTAIDISKETNQSVSDACIDSSLILSESSKISNGAHNSTNDARSNAKSAAWFSTPSSTTTKTFKAVSPTQLTRYVHNQTHLSPKQTSLESYPLVYSPDEMCAIFAHRSAEQWRAYFLDNFDKGEGVDIGAEPFELHEELRCSPWQRKRTLQNLVERRRTIEASLERHRPLEAIRNHLQCRSSPPDDEIAWDPCWSGKGYHALCEQVATEYKEFTANRDKNGPEDNKPRLLPRRTRNEYWTYMEDLMCHLDSEPKLNVTLERIDQMFHKDISYTAD